MARAKSFIETKSTCTVAAGNKKYILNIFRSAVDQSYTVDVFDGELHTRHQVSEMILLQQHYELKEGDFVRMHEEILKNSPSYVHPGPTNAELKQYPALNHAWHEFLLVWRLCGK